ncbi:MAG: hypothetical protein ABR508_02080 [Candidatus Baltobacteraceae bacterium]
MVRNLMLVVCALALTLTSCGRQVTPNRADTGANGLHAGQMQIKYSTQAQLDFVNNRYVLAFDLFCTDVPQNCEPYATYGTQLQNYRNWDFEMVVGQPNASSPVQVAFWQFQTQSTVNGTQKVAIQAPFIPNVDIVINPNCDGNQMQFCLTINRRIFDGVQIANATPPPANGPGGVWYINWIVASPQGGANGQPAGTPSWAPGQQGVNDTTFQFPDGNPGLDVTQSFNLAWTAQPSPPWTQNAGTGPSGQVAGGAVINSP